MSVVVEPAMMAVTEAGGGDSHFYRDELLPCLHYQNFYYGTKTKIDKEGKVA